MNLNMKLEHDIYSILTVFAQYTDIAKLISASLPEIVTKKRITILNIDGFVQDYKENKMAKELTVAEISKKLGYKVKIVKEQPKCYQFKAGDVAKFSNSFSKEKRIMVEIRGELHSVDSSGHSACFAGKGDQEGRKFIGNDYKKVGELKDYIK